MEQPRGKPARVSASALLTSVSAQTALLFSLALNVWLLCPSADPPRAQLEGRGLQDQGGSGRQLLMAKLNGNGGSGRQLLMAKRNGNGRPVPATPGVEGDCASVACPALFTPTPPVELGLSVYQPFLADTRFRLKPPQSMLQLTQALYGKDAVVGQPYIGYSNPYDKQYDLNYRWTQLTFEILTKARALIGRRVRFAVEVGSFIGRSATVIGGFLRAQTTAAHPDAAPLLCIDTWLGDLGMTLNMYHKDKMGKRHGQPTL